MVRAIAAKYGDADAIVRDGRRLTFRQLERASAQAAKALLANGLSKGARIALLLPPSPEFVAFFLGAGRIGAVAVPMSTLYQAPELRYVLDAAEIECLITADRFLRHDYLTRLEEALPGLAASDGRPLRLESAPRLRSIFVSGEGTRPWSQHVQSLLEDSNGISDGLLEAIEAHVTPADPVCIIHTSGSTAHPKGVIHGHGPLVRHSWQLSRDGFPFEIGDRIITTRALFWVAGLVAGLFYSLHSGTCLITTSDGSPADILRLMETEGAIGFTGDAGWFGGLHTAPEFLAAGYDVVRLTVDAGAIVRNGRFLSGNIAARYGTPRHIPAELIPSAYGMTEALGAHTAGRWNEYLPEDRPNRQGRPVPGVTVKIVDPDTRIPLPPGQTGELLIKGYCMMLGLNGKERHEVFDADGFYATGDLCTLDDQGYLKFESRLGDMIKVHGANVAPLEVELVLASQTGIEKAAVVGVPQNGDVLLAAAVQMAPGQTLDEARVIADLKRKLSSFKVPKRIFALDAAEIPITGSGKVKKAELVDLLSKRIAG